MYLESSWLQLQFLMYLGLNLRNIVWHGFMDDSKFNDSYLSLLFVIIMNLNKEIQKKDIIYTKRPQIDLSNPLPSLYSFGSSYQSFSQCMSPFFLTILFNLK